MAGDNGLPVVRAPDRGPALAADLMAVESTERAVEEPLEQCEAPEEEVVEKVCVLNLARQWQQRNRGMIRGSQSRV